MSAIRQGEVYWLDFGPAKGPASAARHPCVVVQGDGFNRSTISTTVVCLITSNLRRGLAPGNVVLRKGDANLTKPSVVNIAQVATVDKAELKDRIGRLPPAAMDTIRSGLQLLFDRT